MQTRKGLLLILLVSALALFGAACGAGEPTRDESGEITETEDVNPNSLQVGDCFNNEDESGTQISELKATPCDEPHNNEVFHVFDLDDGDFPGQEEVRSLGSETCQEEVEAWLGGPAGADFAVQSVTPTEQSWQTLDDRTVICSISRADGSEVTGSLEGSAGAEAQEDTSAE